MKIATTMDDEEIVLPNTVPNSRTHTTWYTSPLMPEQRKRK
jgi:hypothetical protein